jgi:hypothetical protein
VILTCYCLPLACAYSHQLSYHSNCQMNRSVVSPFSAWMVGLQTERDGKQMVIEHDGDVGESGIPILTIWLMVSAISPWRS